MVTEKLSDLSPVDYVLRLDDPRATLAVAGGKGASLARLSAAGLPVPPGFHVTTEAYRQFVAENELQGRILAALGPARPDDPASLDAATATIDSLFLGGHIPEAIAAAVLAAYTGLPGDEPAVAVRSSATAEDLPGLSFAGQHETYLNIRGGDAMLEAVRRCWASLWTARAIGYRGQNKIDPASVALAVVVQALVPAASAGILFTANPLNGRRDQIVVNAAWGLGEAIVGGQVTPDTLVIDRATQRVVSRQTQEKTVMTVRTPTRTAGQPVPEELRRRPVLDDPAVLELARLGERIETLYGMPVDIEWARADGQFAILQARPVTALPEAGPSAPVEWKLPNPKGMYMRAGIIELLPEPLSPLFASMGLRAFNQVYPRIAAELLKSKNAFPEAMITQINDYGYYDGHFTTRQMLTLLVRMPFFVVPILRSAETRWKDRARPALERCMQRWKDKDLDGLAGKELLEGVGEILTLSVDHYGSIQSGVLPAAYMSEAIFTQFYKKLVFKPSDPTALTFMLGFDSLPIRAEKSLYDLAQWSRVRPELATWLVETPASRIAVALGELTPLVGAPAEDWIEFKTRFSAHLAQFGHAIYDLDFASPVPADNPAPLLETFKHLIQGQGTNPYQRQQEATERRAAAVQQLEGRLKGWKLAWFSRLCAWAQRYAPLREDSLGDVGLGWPLLRKMLLELGQRLANGGAIVQCEDVFWLTEGELAGLVDSLDAKSSLPDQTQAVSEHKARLRAASRLVPPPVLPRKSKWAGMDLEKLSPARVDDQAGNTIRGIAASPGQVTAAARVLRGPEDFDQMRQGDVLVAAITTPAWTPLFPLAAGVVTDVGGPLSHSSIVAREYGIPAVLGTGVATRRIRTGQQVKVDGSEGIVTLLP